MHDLVIFDVNDKMIKQTGVRKRRQLHVTYQLRTQADRIRRRKLLRINAKNCDNRRLLFDIVYRVGGDYSFNIDSIISLTRWL